MSAPARTYTVRHIQLARALFATIVALMVMLSPDHSANVGLSVFSGYAITCGLVFLIGAWLVAAPHERGIYVLLGIINAVFGMVSGLPPLRTNLMFFVLVISWAAITGLIELLVGLRARKDGHPVANDAISVGALTLLLAVVLLFVRPDYVFDYVRPDGDAAQVTGILLGVGIFGAYAAVIAVFLLLSWFTPARPKPVAQAAQEETEALGERPTVTDARGGAE